jgi:hypothetical protein
MIFVIFVRILNLKSKIAFKRSLNNRQSMLSINLSNNLFWDIDLRHFDENKNRRIIIERVFSMGDLSDIKTIIQFYGIEIIKLEIVNAGFLDNKTLNWASNFLDIPKTKFKCFAKKQLLQEHWNF